MNIKEAGERIKKLYKMRMNGMLWGPTGVGKSSKVKQVTEELEIELISISLLTLESVDLSGYPFPDYESGVVKLLPPEWAKYPDNFKGILLFDEFNHASDDLQKSLYRVLYDHMIGNIKLPKGMIIIGTGNKKEHGARVIDLEIPLEARMHEINVEPDENSWIEWALQKNVHKDIIAYIRAHPEHLYVMPNNREEKVTSGRGWGERVSALLNNGMDSLEDLSGSIGASVAAQFLAFRELGSLVPNINHILEGKKVEIPKRFDVLSYTVHTCLAQIQKEKDNKIILKKSKGYFRFLADVYSLGMGSNQHASYVEATAAFIKDFKILFPLLFPKLFTDSNMRKMLGGIGGEMLE